VPPPQQQQQPSHEIRFSYTTHEMKRNELNFQLYQAYSQSLRSFEKFKWWDGVFERQLKWNAVLWSILERFDVEQEDEHDEEDAILTHENNPFSDTSAASFHSNSPPKKDDHTDALLEAMEEVQNLIKTPPAKCNIDDYSTSLLRELFLWLGSRLNKEMASETVLGNSNDEVLSSSISELSTSLDALMAPSDEKSLPNPPRPQTHKFTNRLRLLESILLLLIEHDAFGYAASLYQPTTLDLIHGNILNKFLIERCNAFQNEYQMLQALQQLPIQKLASANTPLDTITSHVVKPIEAFFSTHSFDHYPRVTLHLLLILQSLSDQYPTREFLSHLIFDVIVKNKWPLKYVSTIVLPHFPFKKMIRHELQNGQESSKKQQLLAFLNQVFQQYFNLYEQQFESFSAQQQTEHCHEFVNNFLMPHHIIINHCYSFDPHIKEANSGSIFPILSVFTEIAATAQMLQENSPDTKRASASSSLPEQIAKLLFDISYKMATSTREYIPLLGTLRSEGILSLEQLSSQYSQCISVVLKCIRDNLDLFYRTQPHVLNDLHKLLEKNLAPGFSKLAIDNQLLRECYLLINSNDTNSTLKREKINFGRNILSSIDWHIQTPEYRKRAIKVFFLSAAHSGSALTGGIDTFLLNNILSQNAGTQLSQLSKEDANKDLDQLFATFGFSSPHHVTKNPVLEGVICHVLLSYLEANAVARVGDTGIAQESSDLILEFDELPQDRSLSDNLHKKDLWCNVSSLVHVRLHLLQELSIHALSSFLLHRFVNIFSLYHSSVQDKNSESDSGLFEKDILELSNIIAHQVKRDDHLRKFIFNSLTEAPELDTGAERNLSQATVPTTVWFRVLTSASVLAHDEGLALLDSICKTRLMRHLSLTPIISAFKRRHMHSPTQIIDNGANRQYVWCTLCMIRAFPKLIPSLEATTSSTSNTISTMDQCALWIAAECATNLSRDHNNGNLSETRQKSLPFWFQFFEYYRNTVEHFEQQGGASVFPGYLRNRYDKMLDECISFFEKASPDVATVYSKLKSWDADKILESREAVEEMLAVSNFGGHLGGDENVSVKRSHPPLPPGNQYQQIAPGQPSSNFGISGSSLGVSNYSQIGTSNMMQSHLQNVQIPQPSVDIPRIPFSSNVASQFVGTYQASKVNVLPQTEHSITTLLPHPLPLPNAPFQNDIDKYRYMQRCVHNALLDNPLSSDVLLLPTMFHHQAGEITDSSLSQDVLGLFDEFTFCTCEQQRLDKELNDIYANLYTVDMVSQTVNLVTPHKTLVPASIPVSRVKFALGPNVYQQIEKNRDVVKSISERLNDNVTALSLFCTSFEKIATNKKARHGAVKIYLKLLPKLLDHQGAADLNQIWKHFVRSVSKIGENIVSQENHLQKRLLKILMETPRNHVYLDKSPAPMPNQHRPGAPEPLLYKASITEKDFFELYKAFNPSVLLSNKGRIDETIADYIDVLELLYHAHESISTEEFRAFKERLSIESLFSLFAEKPSGQRFSESPEMSRLIELMKNSLCNAKTRETIGNDILRHAVEIAFPLEVSPFLELLLHISCSGEYDDDLWPSKLLYAELLPQVDTQTALEWISIVNGYATTLSASGVVAAASLVERIITKSQLQNTLQRENIYADRWNESLLFFTRCFMDDKEELKRPLDAEQFTSILQSLRTIVESLPIFIDRFFNLYASVLHPYALQQDFQHRQHLSDMVQTLQQWKYATFHEQSPKPFEQMWEILPHDPQSISAIFSQLNFDFVTRNISNSRLLCSLVRLFLDVNLVKPESIPEVLRDAIEDYDPYARQPIWTFLSSRDLSYLFNGYTLSRLYRLCALRQDASKMLTANIYTLQRAALCLNDANFATVAMREISNCVTLIVHERHNPSCSFFHSPKRIMEIFQKVLFPLAMKYPSALVIQIYFGLISSLEEKVEPILSEHTIQFANHVRLCPFEASTYLNGQSSSGDKEAHSEMMDKVHGIVEQLCKNAPESFCRVCIAIVPRLQIRLLSKVQLLESLLCSFLEQTTEEHPRAVAAALIDFGQDIQMHSPQYDNILRQCCQHQCAILLTVLLHKSVSESTTISVHQPQQYMDKTPIKNLHILNMNHILSMKPHETKNYEILFLYLFALEMMESEYWDFNDPAAKDLTQRFLQYLQFFGSRHSLNLTDKVKKNNLPEEFRELDISPQTALACKAIEVYVERMQLMQRDAQSTGGSLLSSFRNSEQVFLPKLKALVGQRKKSAFKAYPEFFGAVQLLRKTSVGMDAFKGILRTLFPYPDYLLKV